MLSVKQLEAFMAVVDGGSFQAAARRLHASQPAISRRIAELEQSLGVRLFERTTRTCHLTPHGRLLVPHGRNVLRDLGDISAAVAEPASVVGLVRIGLVETIALTKLPDLLARLARDYPGLRPEIEVDVTSALVQRLLAREIDVAILVAPVAEPELNTEPLWDMELAWFGAASRHASNRKLVLDDLADECVLLHTRSGHGSIVRRWFREAGLRPRRVVGCSSLAALIRVVESGFGIGLLPRASVEESPVGTGLVYLPTTLSLPRNPFVLTSHIDEMAPATHACIRSIRAAGQERAIAGR
jgi:DNA-binding transcriptional LysR family regulator